MMGLWDNSNGIVGENCVCFITVNVCCMYFLEQSEFQTQKEAAWAISNLTISGRKEQVSDYG